MKVRISEIVVGERRRDDMGNIQELADSIKKYGLLHPVVIDEQKRLVAGGRRLEACKLLGWEEIPVTFLGELSEKQLREIELEENLQRKDLTEYEKSKNLVEIVAIKREQAKTISQNDIVSGGNTFCPTVGQKIGHRPKRPDSLRSIAKELDIPVQTLVDAHQHVQAVEKYPELEQLPKMQAIQTAKKLDALPPEVKPKVIETLKTAAQTEIKPDKTPEEEERAAQLVKAQKFKTDVDRLIDRLHLLSKYPPPTYFQGMDEIEWAFSSVSVFAENRLSMIDAAIEWLGGFRDEYAKRLVNKNQGIRRVK